MVLLATALALAGCFSSVVNSPDGKSAFLLKCDQMKSCYEDAKARCQQEELGDNPLRVKTGQFQVWTGEFEQHKERFVRTYDLVEGTGTWADPPSYSVVVKDDPDAKKPREDQLLVAHCVD
jgi:hypothetical protein